jgi:anti-sigma factor RsiW
VTVTDMTHAEIQEILPAYVRGGSDSLTVRRHLANCTDCRTELARYEDLLGALATMGSVTAEPPTGLVVALHGISRHAGRAEQVRTHLTRNKATYVGGVAVIVAGAAGAALLRSRSRRLATA